jgi:hypothetical protein
MGRLLALSTVEGPTPSPTHIIPNATPPLNVIPNEVKDLLLSTVQHRKQALLQVLSLPLLRAICNYLKTNPL